MPTNEYAAWQARERQRVRPLTDELMTIFRYPLQDRVAFILLALFTGLFGFAARFTVYALPFSQGVLLWYSFHSLYQVAKGNMRHAMPEFTDLSDLYCPLRLSAGVLLIGWAPALLLMAILGSSIGVGEWIWGSTEDSTAECTFGLSLLIGLVLAWKVAYTPVALTVAALSHNFWSIVNPRIGVDTIRRMGPVYIQAMLIYSGFVAVRWAMGSALGSIPVVGGIAMSFVDAYYYLAVGCLLGLAVFKRAPELGWD
jgi:hypothetical protein